MFSFLLLYRCFGFFLEIGYFAVFGFGSPPEFTTSFLDGFTFAMKNKYFVVTSWSSNIYSEKNNHKYNNIM